MEETIWALTLHPASLWLLASLLQIDSPIGIQERFDGLVNSEVEALVQQARQELTRRDLAQFRPDGPVELDAGVVSLVIATAAAGCTLAVFHSTSDHTPRIRYIHLAEGLLVEQETLPDGQVMLTAVRDAETLAQRLAEFIGLAEAPIASGPAAELSQADLAAARELAGVSDVAACRAHLRSTGIPAAVAAALAETLVGGQAISAVVLHREVTELRVGESLAWLAGRAGVWRALPAVGESGQVRIRLAPATTAEVHDQIKRLLLHEEHEDVRK